MRRVVIFLLALALLFGSCLNENSLYYFGSNANAESQYETLKPGSKGQAVLDARMRLYELGYFKKVPTQTEYTKNMMDYVKKFEKDYGLKQDGILSPEDQEVLFGNAKDEEAASEAESKYTTLQPGSKGQAVLDARMRLYELGYFSKVPTQTEYTKNMMDYVKKFEKDYGLKQDGILSPEDQEVLFRGEIVTFKSIEIGNCVAFGQYEQDGDKSNGKESIEWIVLEKEGSRIFVISKYCLDCRPYNTTAIDAEWKNCTLRSWLNTDFISAAFNSEEQSMIPVVTVPGIEEDFSLELFPSTKNKSQDTRDKIFLISAGEALKYFDSNELQNCEVTEYAKQQGSRPNDWGSYRWWLRSSGFGRSVSFGLDFFVAGPIEYPGKNENGTSFAVRPAMWIDLATAANAVSLVKIVSDNDEAMSKLNMANSTPQPTATPMPKATATPPSTPISTPKPTATISASPTPIPTPVPTPTSKSPLVQEDFSVLLEGNGTEIRDVDIILPTLSRFVFSSNYSAEYTITVNGEEKKNLPEVGYFENATEITRLLIQSREPWSIDMSPIGFSDTPFMSGQGNFVSDRFTIDSPSIVSVKFDYPAGSKFYWEYGSLFLYKIFTNGSIEKESLIFHEEVSNGESITIDAIVNIEADVEYCFWGIECGNEVKWSIGTTK